MARIASKMLPFLLGAFAACVCLGAPAGAGAQQPGAGSADQGVSTQARPARVLQSEQNEEGDRTMRIESQPRAGAQQQVPPIGPVMVVPQVNQGGRTGPVYGPGQGQGYGHGQGYGQGQGPGYGQGPGQRPATVVPLPVEPQGSKGGQ